MYVWVCACVCRLNVCSTYVQIYWSWFFHKIFFGIHWCICVNNFLLFQLSGVCCCCSCVQQFLFCLNNDWVTRNVVDQEQNFFPHSFQTTYSQLILNIWNVKTRNLSSKKRFRANGFNFDLVIFTYHLKLILFDILYDSFGFFLLSFWIFVLVPKKYKTNLNFIK